VAFLRTVSRGGHQYFYLVQAYRWKGSVYRRERYLGTRRPRDLVAQKEALEREVWGETWFPEFEAIRRAYQDRLRSLPESVLEQEREDFVIEFTFDTNRIEGSTLTFEETASLLTKGISPSAKPMDDVRETQLHASLVRRLIARPEPVDLTHLLAWHRTVFGETKPDIAGRIRNFDVRIRGSRHLPPTASEVRPGLNEAIRRAVRGTKAVNPVERASTFHFQFEHIHPFGDGNGRIGRLAMNMLLLQKGYPMQNIRYGQRPGYYRALERGSVTSNPHPFLLWFFHRYLADQKVWLRMAPKG
jgi:Fic family protein